MLVDTPYFAYPESPAWKRLRLRELIKNKVKIWMFRNLLRHVNVVVAQTPVMESRLKREYSICDTAIVPNAVPLDHLESENEYNFDIGGSTKLLCLSYYYTHKNLEIFLDLADLFRRNGDDCAIVTTISEQQHPYAKRFLKNVRERGLERYIVNIGPVDMPKIPSLYRSVDALLLPSLLESFSGTYVEAMFCGLPILTSDLDFAHVCCGDVAYYFDPNDAADIYRVIQKVRGDHDGRLERVALGRNIASSSAQWGGIVKRFLELLD